MKSTQLSQIGSVGLGSLSVLVPKETPTDEEERIRRRMKMCTKGRDPSNYLKAQTTSDLDISMVR